MSALPLLTLSFRLTPPHLIALHPTPPHTTPHHPTPHHTTPAGFLSVQYSAVTKLAIPLSFFIWFSYLFRPSHSSDPELDSHSINSLSNSYLGFLSSISFLLGCVCSALSGYLSMWCASHSNIRVAAAARRSYGEALIVCFRGGAFSAVLNITLCLFGVTVLFVLLYITNSRISTGDVPMLMVGYGFGASFVALFMQLGGGIYTKAADVGADLVGKVEQSIPEVSEPRGESKAS